MQKQQQQNTTTNNENPLFKYCNVSIQCWALKRIELAALLAESREISLIYLVINI